ncbi:MAG: hypothetical protein J5705_02770 [Bacteroidaceae bacterium]|nr:hypothetical protein [Bacteroidaceae bacterium]
MRKYQKPSTEVIELKMEGQILQFSGVNAAPMFPEADFGIDMGVDLGLDMDVIDNALIL